MRKYILSIFAFLISAAAYAQSPWYFGTGEAVNLTNGIASKNGHKIISGTGNPSAVAVSAPAGSIYQSTSGTVYVKQDSGLSTNWLPIGVAAPSSLSTINGQSGPAVSIATGSSGTDFNISSGSNTITLNLPTASASNRGLLSSSDYSTFSAKEPAITAGTTSQIWQGDKSWIEKSSLPISTATQSALDLKAPLASPTFTGTVSGITKAMVGLGNVPNLDTSDPANISQSASYRFVTDTEKATWNGKQDAITGAASTITSSNLTASRALISNGSGKVAASATTDTELGYVSGVTSAIQTQLNAKEPTITTLSLAKGGTNKNITPVTGGIVWTDNDSMEVIPAGTSGQVLASIGAGQPYWQNPGVSATTQAGNAFYAEELQAPNNLLTATASNKILLENGNNNLLVNPSFEHLTLGYFWNLTTGSQSLETAKVKHGNRAIKITLSSQTLEFYQSSTRYNSTLAGSNLDRIAWVATTLSNIFVCPRVDGTNILSFCVPVDSSGSYNSYNVPYPAGSISNGVVIVSGTMSGGVVTPGAVTGDVFFDGEMYVGESKSLSPASVITPWVSYTPTFVGFGTVTVQDFKWRQVGSNVEIIGTATSGATPTGVEARISLPNSYTSSVSPSLVQVGTAKLATSTASGYINQAAILSEPGTSYIVFQAPTTSALTKGTGSGIQSASSQLTLYASVPVSQLSGSTQVFAMNCGAGCENTFRATLDIGAGTITDSNISGWIASVGGTSSSRTVTFATSLFPEGAPTCSVVPATSSSSALKMQTYTVSSTAISAIGLIRSDTFVQLTTGTVVIDCSRNSTGYQSSRTIVGSFKEVVTAPGITKPKTCYVGVGGASSTLAAPTELTTGTGVEVYDTCGTASPPSWGTGNRINDLTFASGTFAANTPVLCSCVGYDLTADSIRNCPPVFQTGDSTWSSNSSGGYVANFVAVDQSGTNASAYYQFRCEGQAP